MSEPTSPGPAGRRELNKARTRRALIDATRKLGQERGLENVTAEEIAERAGVSRRTFFNYFQGIESVVAAGLAEPLERIADALRCRPADEQPITAITAALRERPLGAEILLGWVPTDPTASLQSGELHLRVWQHYEEWLVGILQERLGTADDLRVRSLAAAVMAMFGVAQKASLLTAGELSPEDAVTALNEKLVRALEHAGTGWQEPHLSREGHVPAPPTSAPTPHPPAPTNPPQRPRTAAPAK